MMVVMERDEDMALFFEMRRRGVDDDSLPAFNDSDDLDGSDIGYSSDSRRVPSMHVPLMDADDFLNLENDATDYDWLLTPPDIPLFPLLEMESPQLSGKIESISGQHTSMKTKPSDTLEDPNSGLGASGLSLDPTKTGKKTRSATKRTISIERKVASAKPSRSSTPNSRASMNSTSQPKKLSTRSSTPSLPGSHLSTSSGKPSASVASKSAPRSSTPIRKESSSAVRPSVSAPCNSSDTAKCAQTKPKKAAMIRSKVPAVKTHEALDAPLRSKTLLPERPASTSRGRPGVSNHKLVSTEASSNEKQRQKSCSPPRVRAPNTSGFSGRNFISAWNRAHSKDADSVNPVIIGSQMVERAVNMRKLAPPKPEGHCGQDKSTGKSSLSRDSSGFGLSLSKKSLDMAIRHMSIKGSPTSKLKPLNTKIAASSGRSTPTGSTKSTSTNLTDSPFATSSDTSSDPLAHFSSNYSYRSEAVENAPGGEKVIS